MKQTTSFSVLPPPPGIRGNDFCVISQAGGATAKLEEPGWGHIQGAEMILGSQAGGDCFIMTDCWYFNKMLHLEFYKFCLRRYLIFFLLFHERALLGVIALFDFIWKRGCIILNFIASIL